MTTQFYIECFASGFFGLLLSTLLILKSLQRKARIGNLQFSIGQYLKDEVLLIVANFVWVAACLFFIKYFMRWKPEYANFVVFGFFFIGYLGSDVASRLASVANRRLNAGLDFKTTKADEAAGLDPKIPTPTTLPKDTR